MQQRHLGWMQSPDEAGVQRTALFSLQKTSRSPAFHFVAFLLLRRAGTEQEVPPGADSSLKAEEKDKQERNERTLSLSASSELREEEQLTPLEKELQQEEEIRRLHQQDTLLQQVMLLPKKGLSKENQRASSPPFYLWCSDGELHLPV